MKRDPTKPKKPSIFSRDYEWKTYEGPMGNADQWRNAARERFTNAQIAEILQDDSPWSVLGLQPGASPKEIKAAFRRLAKNFHPDRNPDIKDAEGFRKINAAYQKLNAQ